MPSSTNPLKLLCDENMPKKLVEMLREQGYDVAQAPAGSPDTEVAGYARSAQRVVVTFDKHFSNKYFFPPESYFGIIFLRIDPPIIAIAATALRNLFAAVKANEFPGKLFVVGPMGFREYPKRWPRPSNARISRV